MLQQNRVKTLELAVGISLLGLASLSIFNSFVGHMTPDMSIYLLEARTFVETLNRFTLSWENKGILLTFILALPVRVLGPNVAAAAFAQLAAHAVSGWLLFRIARRHASRSSSIILVLLALCIGCANRLWGSQGRPEDFALPLCLGAIYAGLKATPRWWAIGGAAVAGCFFLKFTLVAGPAAALLTALAFDAVQQRKPDGAWHSGRAELTANVGWMVLGFTIVAALLIGWIALFDDLWRCYRQTIELPIQWRKGGAFSGRAVATVLSILDRSSLNYLAAGSVLGLCYAWHRNLRREALLVGAVLIAELFRMLAEGMPFNYLASIAAVAMVLAVSYFGDSSESVGPVAILAWAIPLYLATPLLVPTVREQLQVFKLRVIERLPSPQEYLARQMRTVYRPGERIFVNETDQQIVLLLGAPPPLPVLFEHLQVVGPTERANTIADYEKSPPDWIITNAPEKSTVPFTMMGAMDYAYFLYVKQTLAPDARLGPAQGAVIQAGTSLSPVGSAKYSYMREVDIGYLQAWHLLGKADSR